MKIVHLSFTKTKVITGLSKQCEQENKSQNPPTLANPEKKRTININTMKGKQAKSLDNHMRIMNITSRFDLFITVWNLRLIFTLLK